MGVAFSGASLSDPHLGSGSVVSASMSASWVVIGIMAAAGVWYYLDRRSKVTRQVPIEVMKLMAARNAKDYARVLELGPDALGSITAGPMYDTWMTTTLRVMAGANLSLSRFAEAARCCEEILRFTDDPEIVSQTRALRSQARACQVVSTLERRTRSLRSTCRWC